VKPPGRSDPPAGPAPPGASFRSLWALEPGIDYLNHGSFGACPKAVLEHQADLRRQLESHPARFLARELEGRLDAARVELARFVGADPEGLAFVPNATTGVNTILHGLPLQPGDELLTTDHAYGACRNALEATAARAGAKVVRAKVPFPLQSEEQIVGPILEAVSKRTRLALLDHVTSPTALVFPIERLVKDLRARGVETLVDGAHAPGMVPLDLARIGAAYYTGNAHKWLCAPKGAAFLHVREDLRAATRPLVISHGATAALAGRSRFRHEFDWMGTCDPTPWLSIPEAIRHLGGLLPGGWPELMARNRALALRGRLIVAQALGIDPPCPESLIGSMATLPLTSLPAGSPKAGLTGDALAGFVFDRRQVEAWFNAWGDENLLLVRLSAQLYNSEEEYARLALAVHDLVGGTI
jgi:isopenicillin-N epimerase